MDEVEARIVNIISAHQEMFDEIYEFATEANLKISKIIEAPVKDTSFKEWVFERFQDGERFRSLRDLCAKHRFLMDDYYLPYLFAALLHHENPSGAVPKEAVFFLRQHRSKKYPFRQADREGGIGREKAIKTLLVSQVLLLFENLSKLHPKDKSAQADAIGLFDPFLFLPDTNFYLLVFAINRCLENHLPLKEFLSPMLPLITEALSGNTVWSTAMEGYTAELVEWLSNVYEYDPDMYRAEISKFKEILSELSPPERTIMWREMTELPDEVSLEDYLRVTRCVLDTKTVWPSDWFLAMSSLTQLGFPIQRLGQWISDLQAEAINNGTIPSADHNLVPKRLLKLVSRDKGANLTLHDFELLLQTTFDLTAKLGRMAGEWWLKIIENLHQVGKASSISGLSNQIGKHLPFKPEVVQKLILSQISKCSGTEFLNDQWFDELNRVLDLSWKNVFWISSNDYLAELSQEAGDLRKRWECLSRSLRERLPKTPGHVPMSWRFEDKEPQVVELEISLFSRLAAGGAKGIEGAPTDRFSYQVAPVTNWKTSATTVQHRFWATVLQKMDTSQFDDERLGVHALDAETASLLLEGLNAPEVDYEISKLLTPPIRQRVTSLAGFEHAKHAPNFSELLFCLNNMEPDEFEFNAFVDLGKAALRRYRRHAPRLELLYSQIQGLNANVEAFDEIQIGFSPSNELSGLFTGFSSTGCCTDGPDGLYAVHSLSCSLHSRADKILIERPHPERRWESPQAFGSIWIFDVDFEDGKALLVDSIEVGSDVFRMLDGEKTLAQHLVQYFRNLHKETAKVILFNLDFFNVVGRKVLHSMMSDPEFDVVQRHHSIRFDCHELTEFGVEEMYLETAPEKIVKIPNNQAIDLARDFLELSQ